MNFFSASFDFGFENLALPSNRNVSTSALISVGDIPLPSESYQNTKEREVNFISAL